MSLSVDWTNKVIESTESILDLPAFKDAIRLLEESEAGILHDPIITYKKLDLGSGAYFHAVDLINSYVLKFIGAGPFYITGNLNGTIVPNGQHIERKTSAAFATTSTEGGGTGGLTEEQAGQLLSTLTKVTDVSTLHGLETGKPLRVTRTSRQAGSISQQIEESGDTITVTRQ
jgi:hypothetical protein